MTRQQTYHLDEPGPDGNLGIPEIIGISTPDGDVFVRREDATLAQVRQWVAEGEAHHARALAAIQAETL